MAPRAVRTVLRLASDEGLENPHSKLVAQWHGREISVSFSLTKQSGNPGRHTQYLKQNIRHAKRAADEGIPYWGYQPKDDRRT